MLLTSHRSFIHSNLYVPSIPESKIRIYINQFFKHSFLILLFSLHFRCREKQRKEASRLQTVNRKLSAMNKLLMEENDRLQKQVSQLVYENGHMRQQLHTVS